jgi:hydroxymethylpyrimidine pyrophosphatase-like HAD family hydrolase
MTSFVPRVVACDLDGTLLRSDGTIDPRTRRALARIVDGGAVFVLCTARPSRWLGSLVEEIGHRGVAICATGGVVWDLRTGSALESFPLAPEGALQVVRLLSEALPPGGAWAVERVSGFGREPGYNPRWPAPADTEVAPIETLLAAPAVKLMLRHHGFTADDLLGRALELGAGLGEFCHSNAHDPLLEISAPGVSKASTLARFCASRGVRFDQVIAFGDMPNDLPMLQWAGHGVAVANAHADVLAAADEVTAANDDAGVAQVLERVFAGL